MAAGPGEVCEPGEYADLGSRAAVDKKLKRPIAGDQGCVDRGLYNRPRKNEVDAYPQFTSGGETLS